MGKIRPSKLFWATFVRKDKEKCRQSKLGIHDHFRSFQTTLVGKKLEKKCEQTKIKPSKSFWTILVEKDWKKCEMTKIGCSELFWTTLVEKIGKKCEVTKIKHSKSF